MEIRYTQNNNKKEIPNDNDLIFGKVYADHMFQMDYTEGIGWHDASIIPFGPITLDPTALVLHYGQETFEGMKAYRNKQGDIRLFRPYENAKRMQVSNERLCMPIVPEVMFVEAIEALLRVDKEWIPTKEGTSLYIRPFMFATEAGVGVKPASSYRFMIVTSPVGSYYEEGVSPVKIWVEDTYTRAATGGTGFIKCGGNYAGSLLAQKNAQQNGYTQVLWLDGETRNYVEEVGTMNVMFLINNTLITPPIEGTILPGITRSCVLTLVKDWGYQVEERKISIEELMNAASDGSLQEAFGTGTAAVISPIGELAYQNRKHIINNFKTGSLTQKIYDMLTGIQDGSHPDDYGWSHLVK